MHILYIHQYFSTPDGSSGTRSYEMARKLIARGHRVTMVCGYYINAKSGLQREFINGKRTGIVDGIEVIEYDLPYSNNINFITRTKLFILFALNAIHHALFLEYDVLFATSTPLTVALPGIIMKLFRRKKFIFEVRDLWPELPREMGVITNPIILKAMDILEWMAYHSSDHCIGLSQGIVDGIVKRNIAKENTTLIPNGCDLEIFKPQNKKQRLYTIPGIQQGDFVASFSGAHGMANGLDAVIDAAVILKKKGNDSIKLLFIGNGKLKKGLEDRAKNNLLNNCIFIDSIPKRNLAGIISASDAGLMILANVKAFYNGTSPNKFFDYISSGIPVINNYPGWVANMITKNECGIAVPPGDADAFANALLQLFEDPTKKDQMGFNARKLAENEFDRDLLSNRFADCVEKINQF